MGPYVPTLQGNVCSSSEFNSMLNYPILGSSTQVRHSPENIKRYHDLKRQNKWHRIDSDVTILVISCLVCQMVKLSTRTRKKVWTLETLTSNWGCITMDFVIRLPHSQKESNVVMGDID